MFKGIEDVSLLVCDWLVMINPYQQTLVKPLYIDRVCNAEVLTFRYYS